MAFLVFEQYGPTDNALLRPTGETFRLAGYNLIYKAWENRGKPLNEGWQVTHEELVRIQFPHENGISTKRLVIDFDPGADWRIGLIEPAVIYAYCFSYDNKTVGWTPLMLRLRDVFYCDTYDPPLTPERKTELLGAVSCSYEGEEAMEFLYLNGDSRGWNWGKNGMTNAAFIQGGAREYFRRFF